MSLQIKPSLKLKTRHGCRSIWRVYERKKKKDPRAIKNLSHSFLVFANQKLQETDEEVYCTIPCGYILQQRESLLTHSSDTRRPNRNIS